MDSKQRTSDVTMKFSDLFTEHLELADLTYQLASPGDHRTNPAEQAIQTSKNHFIAILSGTDEDFPTTAGIS